MTDDEIRLALPAAPDFARLARLTVAGLASRLGFSYDEVEDLRIAVGEACSMLVGTEGRPGTITLVYGLRDDGIDIDAQGDFPDGHPGPDATAVVLSERILEAVVDRFDFDPEADRVHLHKRRSDA